MEVYVDNLLVKSKDPCVALERPSGDLCRIEEVQNEAEPRQMCIWSGVRKVPQVCGVRRGIEANPEKVNVVLDMLSPQNINDVQKLTSLLVALNRFMSRSTDKCLPFFKVLRKGQD